jgi:hypothetical protein
MLCSSALRRCVVVQAVLHLHVVHPVLGIEEVQLEEGQAATLDRGSKDEGQHQRYPQQQQHSLSR